MNKFKSLLMVSILSLSMTGNAEGVKKLSQLRANLDTSVAPGQDFYEYSCGGWMKHHPLEAQYSRYGQFDALAEKNKEQLKELIQNLGKQNNAKGSVAQKVNDLYSMGLDSVRLNKEGNAPLQPALAKIAKAKKSDATSMITWLHSSGVANPFFGLSVEADLKDSNSNMLYLGQSGMGLGDRDYYLEKDKNTVAIRNAYKKFIKDVFKLAGYKGSVDNVMKVETALAEVAMSREEQRDMVAQYNIRSIDQLKKDYPNINWDSYFAGLGLNGVDKVCVTQLRTMAKVNDMLGSISEKELRDYLAFSYIKSACNYLSDDFVNASFDMFGKAMAGKSELQPRWKRAIDVPNSLLGQAVGQLYVEKYFGGESKTKMLKLVDNLKKSLAEHISNLTWMSEKTKVNALVKLNSFTVKVGYPDKWRDYSEIQVDPSESYWTNVEKAVKCESDYQLSKYGKPVDRDEWFMTPQTVNAYYNPTTNEICFPAGILQAPYFDVNADDALNYGAIGVVIGHEMTHGFDDQGRQFDQDGNMVDWWTAEDAEKFKGLTDKLAEQFNAIEVAPGVHANGRFTLGENIADQGGLRVAYTAFKKTEQGQGDKMIDGFTPDQRFYLSYANVWANNITEKEILRRTKTDPHSLGRWRVNASLKNVEQFFNAFDIKEGDAMFRPVAERVIIW